jgi:hypothetical protein
MADLRTVNITIASGAALSEAIRGDDLLGNAGMVYIPAWTAASLGFKISDTENGAYVPLRNEFGSLVEITGIQTAAAGWYKLPTEMMGAAWFKLWSETSGSDTNQGSARACKVAMKG